jgi:hypothetical protein
MRSTCHRLFMTLNHILDSDSIRFEAKIQVFVAMTPTVSGVAEPTD